MGIVALTPENNLLLTFKYNTMSKFAHQIEHKEKLYYTGVGSINSRIAKEKGLSIKNVKLTGHHTYLTVSKFAYYENPSELSNGIPKIDGIPSCNLPVATEEESIEFFCNVINNL